MKTNWKTSKDSDIATKEITIFNSQMIHTNQESQVLLSRQRKNLKHMCKEGVFSLNHDNHQNKTLPWFQINQ